MRLFVGNLMRSLLPGRTTTPDVNTLGLEESDQGLLPQFVQLAKQHVGPSLFFSRVTYKITERPSPALYWRLGRFTVFLLSRCH